MIATDYRMTRRNILIGAAASLICAPAIVRAASLMPVRGLPLQFLNPEFLDPLGQFYRRNFYHSLDSDLRAGRAMPRCCFGATPLVGELPRSNGQTTAWPSAPSRAVR
jgi:hypothetical protein